jgi:DNA-binding CsgD family transcriptional regulator
LRALRHRSVDGGTIAERLKFDTLTWLCSAINTTAGVFYLVGDDCAQSHFLTYNVDLSFHRRYVRDLYRLDPLHPRHFQAPCERVITLSDALPAGGRQQSEYFHNFIVPQSIQDVVEIFFRKDERIVAGISLLKYGRGAPLSARDVRLLQDVHPLIESYLRTALSAEEEDAASDVACAFTERERMVLALVKNGLPNKVIARRLAISVPTVKTHIRSILAKTRTTSRATLLAKMFWH